MANFSDFDAANENQSAQLDHALAAIIKLNMNMRGLMVSGMHHHTRVCELLENWHRNASAMIALGQIDF